jgi:hypothetical protein
MVQTNRQVIEIIWPQGQTEGHSYEEMARHINEQMEIQTAIETLEQKVKETERQESETQTMEQRVF